MKTTLDWSSHFASVRYVGGREGWFLTLVNSAGAFLESLGFSGNSKDSRIGMVRTFSRGAPNTRPVHDRRRLVGMFFATVGECSATVGECSATVGKMFCHCGRMFCYGRGNVLSRWENVPPGHGNVLPRWKNVLPRWKNVLPRWGNVLPRWGNVVEIHFTNAHIN